MRTRMVYLFICRNNLEIYGYTEDKTGANLPTNFSKCLDGWQYIAGVEMSDDIYGLIGETPKKIIEAIDKNGYFIKVRGAINN